MAAPGGYNISGTGLLEAAQEGTTLSFDNAFNTQSGPDLHVYLSINFESPTTPGNTNIDIAELTSNNGAQSYTIPSNVALGDYNYVLIHCKSFNHWWGGGLLGEINCVSATDGPGKEITSSVYPNPAVNEVTFTYNSNEIDKIMITDMLGQTRFVQSINQNETKIDLSGLKPGLFIVEGINAKGRTLVSQRVIKM